MNTLRLGKLVMLLLVWMSMEINAMPLQDDQVAVAIETGSKINNRKARSLFIEHGVPWHLDRIDQHQLPLDRKFISSEQGYGVDIYIFAEGIQYDHKVFSGRAFNGGFAPDQMCSRIGTQLASLAAGEFVGVARKAHVYSINILKCQQYTSVSIVIQALRYVIQRANETNHHRSVIVLPLVGPNRTDIFNPVIKEAVDNNIVVITPAGNHRDNACRFSPGNSPYAINVGATQLKDRDDELYWYPTGGSNFGDCISLYAPGHSIVVADHNHGYSVISGTHAACGIVAGAAALVLEKFPHYTPEKVKRYLMNVATDGVIAIPEAFQMRKNINKLLYVGTVVDYEDLLEQSGSGEVIEPSGYGGIFLQHKRK